MDFSVGRKKSLTTEEVIEGVFADRDSENEYESEAVTETETEASEEEESGE